MFEGRTYYKLLEEEFPGLPLDVSWLELSTRFSIDQKMLQLFFFNKFQLNIQLVALNSPSLFAFNNDQHVEWPISTFNKARDTFDCIKFLFDQHKLNAVVLVYCL